MHFDILKRSMNERRHLRIDKSSSYVSSASNHLEAGGTWRALSSLVTELIIFSVLEAKFRSAAEIVMSLLPLKRGILLECHHAVGGIFYNICSDI